MTLLRGEALERRIKAAEQAVDRLDADALVLVRAYGNYQFACGEWTNDDDEPYESHSQRARLAELRLLELVGWLLAGRKGPKP